MKANNLTTLIEGVRKLAFKVFNSDPNETDIMSKAAHGRFANMFVPSMTVN